MLRFGLVGVGIYVGMYVVLMYISLSLIASVGKAGFDYCGKNIPLDNYLHTNLLCPKEKK